MIGEGFPRCGGCCPLCSTCHPREVACPPSSPILRDVVTAIAAALVVTLPAVLLLVGLYR